MFHMKKPVLRAIALVLSILTLISMITVTSSAEDTASAPAVESELPSGILSDGYYRIRNASTGTYFDSYDIIYDYQGTAYLDRATGQNGQDIYISRCEDGTYTLTPQSDGAKYNISTAAGAYVTKRAAAEATERFDLILLPTGDYAIAPVANNADVLVMTASTTKTRYGYPRINLTPFNDTVDQRWVIEPIPVTGVALAYTEVRERLYTVGTYHASLHNTHLYGLLELAKRNGISKVYVHGFLDGRDTPPASGKEFAEQLEAKMSEIGVGKIASVMGRYYAMDRDNNYDRVQLAYEAMTQGKGETAVSGPAAIQQSYDNDKTDEFVLPTVVVEDGQPVGLIKDGDSVVFYNFRPDRAREITRAFCDDDFKGFDRERLDIKFVCFSDYDPTIPNKSVAFNKIAVTNTFGEWLAANNMTQARIAETEKYAHVTFFFNGGVEEPNKGEERVLVASPKDVATYDLKPQMSAYEVCDKLTAAIKSGEYDVIIINFANPDMVGHTGVEEAAIKAVEVVDECVGKALDAILEVNGTMFICADHGNAEQLVDYETGAPFTAHTTNQVPFILVNYDPAYTLRENGCLADIVPTLIETMGMQKPVEMTGESLLIKK